MRTADQSASSAWASAYATRMRELGDSSSHQELLVEGLALFATLGGELDAVHLAELFRGRRWSEWLASTW